MIVLANVVAGGLVFGQLLTEQVDWPVLAVGAFTTIALYISAIKLFNDYDRTRHIYRDSGNHGSSDSFQAKQNPPQD